MNTKDQNLQWVERLAQTLSENKLHKLEFENEDVSLTIRSKRPAPQPPAAQPVASADSAEVDVEEEDVTIICSKDVGIFRNANKLAAGDTVEKGQKLGVIEAISVEHELISSCAGILVEVVLFDGDPVEYGQPIFVVSESEG